ncbi:hypothetical protein MUK60_42135 [Streptomyces sp. LRE541]|uniref:hypothetical protein n=1 Tax=Streptomyces sp. LRE541 TaxID=2931983 RepID=UPI00200F32DE|nr:hypothetical protein [Streptomyces sp. LRE541]UPZ33826.1 hypothetical protein MUK60_42135 [Streptomyces sp. LRE541]
MQKHAIVQHITRFFRPPRDATRQPPTLARQLVALWLFALALGAGLTAGFVDGIRFWLTFRGGLTERNVDLL